MRQLIENQPFRPRQQLAVLAKLEQHEAKLADLASKYGVSHLLYTIQTHTFLITLMGPQTAFDRLRLRHLHFLLTKAHMDARQEKTQKARLSRASFERHWNNKKRERARLRSDFHELRQEFYNNNQRLAGRHTSAP